MSEQRRKILNAKIAAVAVGGPVGEHLGRILDGTGRARAPELVQQREVRELEDAERLLTRLDLRDGGGVVGQMAKALLRWAVGLLEAEVADGMEGRLHAAVGALAQRAGWAAFDADSHDVARSLFTVGLYAASLADEPNLRAHVLTDFAAQYTYLGFADDALRVARWAEVDERVGSAMLMVINGAKARAYAVKGAADACWRHVELAERAQARAAVEDTGAGGWLATVATPVHLYATTGHATAILYRRMGSDVALAEARQRLTAAVDEVDRDTAPRAAALCMAQLALLHLEAGESEVGQGLKWAHHAVHTGEGVRSARLVDHLVSVRRAVAAHDHEPTAKQLLVDIDIATREGW